MFLFAPPANISKFLVFDVFRGIRGEHQKEMRKAKSEKKCYDIELIVPRNLTSLTSKEEISFEKRRIYNDEGF